MPLPGVFDKQIFLRAAQGMAGAFNQGLYTVAASQTINAGDVVVISSGTVSQAIALPGSNNSGSLSGGSLGTLGVALDSITTNSSGVDTTDPFNKTQIPVALWDANLEVSMRVWNATASNTQLSNLTLGSNYQLGRWRGSAAGQWWYFMSTTTTNGELQYVEQYGLNDQQVTDNYPIVLCRVVAADRQAG